VQELRVDLAAAAGLMPARAVRALLDPLGKDIMAELVLLPLVRLWVEAEVVPVQQATPLCLQKAEMAA
jgi:hypothetical protein